MDVKPFDGHADLSIGAEVYTADGERIGFLMSADAHELQVGDGYVFLNAYTVPIASVARYDGSRVSLRLTAAEFDEGLGR